MKLSKAAGAGSDNKRSDRLQPLFLYNGEALCEGGIFENMQLHYSTSVDY